jgi:16S rRNA (cytidine1402-2'-O)-methyltransferase
VVARELTKMHEEFARGLLTELAERFSSDEKARGEIVLIIDRAVIAEESSENKAESSIVALVASFEEQGLDQRAALKKAARETGIPRAEAYRRLVAEKSKS